MALQLPRLPRAIQIIDKVGLPAMRFQVWWDNVATAVEDALNRVGAVEDDVSQLITAPMPCGPVEPQDPLTPPAMVIQAGDELIPPAIPVVVEDLMYPPFYGA